MKKKILKAKLYISCLLFIIILISLGWDLPELGILIPSYTIVSLYILYCVVVVVVVVVIRGLILKDFN